MSIRPPASTPSEAISTRYLWGHHFYWLCDCSANKKIVEYAHQLRRWSQELMGYDLTVIHRPAQMMTDVDALSRGHHLDNPPPPFEICSNLFWMDVIGHEIDTTAEGVIRPVIDYESSFDTGNAALVACRKRPNSIHEGRIITEQSKDLFWTSLDATAGYHQIAVRWEEDQEKLAFYLPDGRKVTWLVMPFGPMNAPACFIALMHYNHEN
jgi:hypothetical protein